MCALLLLLLLLLPLSSPSPPPPPPPPLLPFPSSSSPPPPPPLPFLLLPFPSSSSSEEPEPEILTGGGKVSCSATTHFNASYCLTITYANGQRMDKICKHHEVKIHTSRMISAITCEVTVYGNASVPKSSLTRTKTMSESLGSLVGGVNEMHSS